VPDLRRVYRNDAKSANDATQADQWRNA
jgi:hypothetical protein